MQQDFQEQCWKRWGPEVKKRALDRGVVRFERLKEGDGRKGKGKGKEKGKRRGKGPAVW